ncbi:VanZ family protein [Fodinibius sp.]|uniref:VanZ family protein n=1 Tax=Fodinibius sp. TaxID=1872440 RepID=UPI002ACDE9CB|nr:VanZ family protein [Fodinibius sp.]MDZ7658357.1 VanZ family protein [Fodinibius sp.]
MNISSSIYSFLSDHSYLLPIGVITLTLGMLLLTLLPADVMGQNKLWSYDKLGHAVLFGSWSLSVGLYYQIHKSKRVKLWIIFASGTTFGLLIEILQHTLPVNRQGDPIDFLFDVLGCLIAIWVLKTILPNETKS